MKSIIIIILSALTVTVQAQISENVPLPEKKDSLSFKLNDKVLQDLQHSFELLSPPVHNSKIELKINLQDYPKIKISNNFHCSTSLLSNAKMGFPKYEQIRTNCFLLQIQTNYIGSPYLLQKQLSLSFPLNDRIAFYVKGSFDWLRQCPVYLSGFIQPINLKTGLSFQLKGENILDLGVKHQYTIGEKRLEIYHQWNTTADCTLHF